MRVLGIAIVLGIIACVGYIGLFVGLLLTFPIGLMALGSIYIALKDAPSGDENAEETVAEPQTQA